MNEDKNYHPKGMHIVFDLYGIPSDVLNSVEYLKQIYKTAILKSGAEIRRYQEEIFEPEGFTFTYILSESHSSCHVYPNENIDDSCLMGCIHTCGEHVNPNIAVDYIVEILKPKEVVRKQLIRGVRENKTME